MYQRQQRWVSEFSPQHGSDSLPSSNLGSSWFHCRFRVSGDTNKPTSLTCVPKTRVTLEARHTISSLTPAVVSLSWFRPAALSDSCRSEILTLTFDSSLLADGYVNAMSEFLYFFSSSLDSANLISFLPPNFPPELFWFQRQVCAALKRNWKRFSANVCWTRPCERRGSETTYGENYAQRFPSSSNLCDLRPSAEFWPESVTTRSCWIWNSSKRLSRLKSFSSLSFS